MSLGFAVEMGFLSVNPQIFLTASHEFRRTWLVDTYERIFKVKIMF